MNRVVAGALGLLAGAALSAMSLRPARAADPVLIGVSGPLTGPAAQYGAQWKKGFDLALDEVNGPGGGIKGRPLRLIGYGEEDV